MCVCVKTKVIFYFISVTTRTAVCVYFVEALLCVHFSQSHFRLFHNLNGWELRLLRGNHFCFNFILFVLFFSIFDTFFSLSFLDPSLPFGLSNWKAVTAAATATIWECFSICFESFKSFKFILVSFYSFLSFQCFFPFIRFVFRLLFCFSVYILDKLFECAQAIFFKTSTSTITTTFTSTHTHTHTRCETRAGYTRTQDERGKLVYKVGNGKVTETMRLDEWDRIRSTHTHTHINSYVRVEVCVCVYSVKYCSQYALEELDWMGLCVAVWFVYITTKVVACNRSFVNFSQLERKAGKIRESIYVPLQSSTYLK